MRGYPEVRGQIEYLFIYHCILTKPSHLKHLYIAHQHLINKMFSIAHTEVTVKMLSKRNKTMGNYSNL